MNYRKQKSHLSGRVKHGDTKKRTKRNDITKATLKF